MSVTLYRKYRPQSWDAVAGQEHVKTTLEYEVATGRIAHAYLFSGPRGVGKTTIARIMAKALNCQDRGAGAAAGELRAAACGTCTSCTAITENAALDVIEMDAASNRGIDAVRDNIVEQSRFAPSRLAFKVFIIDEVHMLTTEAFNALLKTLEEPPKNVVFILATTELHRVPATIVSRCQRFDFKKIPFADTTARLAALAEREGVKVPQETLEEIARQSDGGLRDAEGLLGKVLALAENGEVQHAAAVSVLPRSEAASLGEFVDALVRRDTAAALSVIAAAVDSGADVEQLCGDATELLRKTLVARVAGNADVFAAEVDDARRVQISAWAGACTQEFLVFALETLLAKRQDMKRAVPVQLPLEVGAVRICAGMAEVGGGGAPVAAVTPVAAPAAPVVAPVAAAPATPAPAPAKPAAPVVDAAPAPAPVPEKKVTQADELERIKSAMAKVRGESVAPVAAAPVAAVAASDAAPATEPVAVVAAAATLDADGHITSIAALKSKWGEFTRVAGEANAALTFLLGVGEPVRVDGDMVQVGFDFAFHCDKMNQEKHRRVLEQCLAQVLGKAVKLEGVVHAEKRMRVADDDDMPVRAAAGGFGSAAMAAPRTGSGAGGDGIAAAFGGEVVG